MKLKINFVTLNAGGSPWELAVEVLVPFQNVMKILFVGMQPMQSFTVGCWRKLLLRHNETLHQWWVSHYVICRGKYKKFSTLFAMRNPQPQPRAKKLKQQSTLSFLTHRFIS